MDRVQALIEELTDIWSANGQWIGPGTDESIAQIFHKATDTHLDALDFNPVSILDRGVAEVMILCFDYFNRRGLPAEKVIREQLARMNEERNNSKTSV